MKANFSRLAGSLALAGTLVAVAYSATLPPPPQGPGQPPQGPGAGQPPAQQPPNQQPPGAATPVTPLSAKATLGKAIFFDPALSASGKQSCASCHSPNNAYSAPNALSVQIGGANGNLQGLRNAPSIAYSSYTPAFSRNGIAQGPGQPARNNGPVGGLLLDGRANTLAAQAQGPFLVEFEMGNKTSADVQAKLKTRPYLAQVTAIYGANATGSGDASLAALADALAAFETEDASFHPFTSKYDASLRGQVALTAAESAGLGLFRDPNKGNCASCHSAGPAGNVQALFTDHSFHSLGVPRNWNIAYNLDNTALPDFAPANGISLGSPGHHYYDLGLCGPVRTDLSAVTQFCGLFKVPTLRNVAIKQTYFHNGVYNDLHQVVGFYATRDSNLARIYTKPDGSPDIPYNDLPQAYDGNIERRQAPFNQTRGPSLTQGEVQNLVSFLCTLTDGYDPKNPGAYRIPAQCH